MRCTLEESHDPCCKAVTNTVEGRQEEAVSAGLNRLRKVIFLVQLFSMNCSLQVILYPLGCAASSVVYHIIAFVQS